MQKNNQNKIIKIMQYKGGGAKGRGTTLPIHIACWSVPTRWRKNQVLKVLQKAKRVTALQISEKLFRRAGAVRKKAHRLSPTRCDFLIDGN